LVNLLPAHIMLGCSGPATLVAGPVTDPVCEMEIDWAAAAASEEYQGKTYYFCSEGCHQRFVAAPEQYAV
jgi:YHS domain-containing protein